MLMLIKMYFTSILHLFCRIVIIGNVRNLLKLAQIIKENMNIFVNSYIFILGIKTQITNLRLLVL